jgi:hypothetical protein
MSPINPNILELLITLKNNPQPNSKYLEEKFNVTPAIIEAWMNTLADLKLSIKNYQWDTCFLPLDIPKLKQALHWKNLDIDYRITIPSTHLYLKETTTIHPSPILCIAEHQSAGIGQRQKSWASPFGNNEYQTSSSRFIWIKFGCCLVHC